MGDKLYMIRKTEVEGEYTLRNTITQYNITWNFDTSYKTGQYVNGDYWVLDEGSGITISSMSPTPTTSPGRHGSWVNPVSSYGTASQGWDDRLEPGWYSASLCKVPPFNLEGGDSLVSTISFLTDGDRVNDPDGDEVGQTDSIWLKTCAVLTAVDSIPASGSFRPGYAGTWKTQFNISQLRTNLLPNLTAVTPRPTLAHLEGHFARPWLDTMSCFLGLNLHPALNMCRYGRVISQHVSEALCYLMLDPATVGDTTTLLYRVVQTGIDLYSVTTSGMGWPADGGHMHGRSGAILFAGHMLNNADMLALGTHAPEYTPVWKWQNQDIEDYYYVDQYTIDNTNEGTSCISQAMLGNPEWSGGWYEWRYAGGINTPYVCEDDWVDNTYRRINTDSQGGWALAWRILGLVSTWGHPEFWDYLDRHWTKVERFDGDNNPSFVDVMWDTYRSSY